MLQDELMMTLNKIKGKLDKETEAYRIAKVQLAELDQQVNDLAQLVGIFGIHRFAL